MERKDVIRRMEERRRKETKNDERPGKGKECTRKDNKEKLEERNVTIIKHCGGRKMRPRK